MKQLLWLRSDLRCADNTALCAAMANGPTLAVYFITPEQWQAHDDAPCKVDFWLRNLVDLQRSLGRLNVPLLIRQVNDWQAIPQALLRLCREQQVARVQVNQEYGIHEQRRDNACSELLAEQQIGFTAHLDQLLFAPGTLLTKTGSYFKVFSQFRKACHNHLYRALPSCLPTPAAQAPLALTSDPLPSQLDGFEQPSAALRSLWPAGEDEVQRRLHSFAEQRIEHYAEHRDIPALPGTSQLSAYLAAGVISPRQCLHAALNDNQGEFDSGNPGVITWVNELLWREFYKHILVGFPHVSRHRAFRPATDFLPWRHAPQDLAAWQEGRTGFPIIDAAMRQLLATGWMHNRLRMVVGMFLSKNLLIDWREGERFFMRQLIDGDLAANNGGWQWCASTGTDAAPYFRIFSPISQASRFDPSGDFIRHWLPELSGLSDRELHNPEALTGLFRPSNYPSPIVNLGPSRARALAAFKNLEPLHV